MDFGYPQTTESKILQEYAALVRRYNDLYCGITNSNSLQVYHTGISQTRSPSATAHRSYKRRQLAKRRHPLPQERSLPRRHRVAQPPRIRQWQRVTLRDSWCNQNEVLPVRYARAAAGPERQGHVRDNWTSDKRESGGNGGRQIPPVRAVIEIRE